MHQLGWVKDKANEFDNKIYALKQFYCENCNELWPTDINFCYQCKKNPIKYSLV